VKEPFQGLKSSARGLGGGFGALHHAGVNLNAQDGLVNDYLTLFQKGSPRLGERPGRSVGSPILTS